MSAPRGLFAGLALACAAALAAALPLAPSAWAQDISARRGFSVRLTAPRANEVAVGSVTIRADVTARRPEDVARVDFFVDDQLLLADSEPPYQVVHNFRKSATAHVVRAVAHHREGATVSDFVITKPADFQFVVNVQRVLLEVSVRDAEQRLVRNLSAESFEVFEDGRRQTVRSVSPEKRPLTVGIVLDSSGSMRDRMTEAHEAACGFLAELQEQDRAFAVDFDEQVTLIEEVTPDRDRLCKAIRTSNAVGGTALYDAIHASFRVLRETPAERRALVVLSDGDDTDSRLRFDAVIAEAKLIEVPVYVVGLDVAALSTARRTLGELAQTTGGRAFFVRKAEELKGTYKEVADELRSLYQIVYASDNQKFDGRFLPIEVRVKGGKDFDIRHRSGYPAIEPE